METASPGEGRLFISLEDTAMAATTQDLRQERRIGAFDRRMNPVTAARPLSTEGIRVSWGGIWGGVLTAVGLVLLLAALGMAVGITATDPSQADGNRIGMAAGIWAGVSLLIALFVGGMVSTRIGAIFDGATGFWEGALVWIVTLLAVVYLASTGLSSLMGGAMRVMGAASQSVATAMQGTPAASNAANEAANANPSAMVDQLKSRISDARSNGTIGQKAAEVKPAATKAAWATFGALVLTLLASVLGAVAGRRRHPLFERRR
jgi:hypothetical protein